MSSLKAYALEKTNSIKSTASMKSAKSLVSTTNKSAKKKSTDTTTTKTENGASTNNRAPSPSNSTTTAATIATATTTTTEQHLVLKIQSAKLTKNFELTSLQKMDPFAVIEWVSPSKSKSQEGKTMKNKESLDKTHTEWDAHKHPKWNYTCKSHIINPNSINDELIEIHLWEHNRTRPNVYMGTAKATVAVLVGGGGGTMGGGGGMHQLDIVRKNNVVGTIDIQAIITTSASSTKKKKKDSSGSGSDAAAVGEGGEGDNNTGTNNPGILDNIQYTKVDPRRFILPVKRLGVSGGTAPFFALNLVEPYPSHINRSSHYIGKDLSRATDEIHFYEEILDLFNCENREERALADMFKYFSFEYAGVLARAPEDGVTPTEEDDGLLDLLVLRNLRDGCSKLRLLDIKMGQKTASKNWQGKSWFRAVKQEMFDQLTNSTEEGYRLEGFDGMGGAALSRDPTLDLSSFLKPSGMDDETWKKKLSRFWLQHMHGTRMMMHLLDVHTDEGSGKQDQHPNLDLHQVYTASEYTELVCHELARRLSRLATLSHRVTVPQKWVGSSVALGFDCGILPPRSSSHDEIRAGVLVNIFDWGRSELNTLIKHGNLSPEEQLDRKKFWTYYKGGIERLAHVASQTYYHRYANSMGWEEVQLTVRDFDALRKDEILGYVTVPVVETPPTEIPLIIPGGGGFRASLLNVVGGSGHGQSAATITYSITWRACPVGSRLKGVWRITIERANRLPNKDRDSDSDPYCIITARSLPETGVDNKQPRRSFDQVTSVKPNDLNPVWDEIVDLPISALMNNEGLVEALEDGGVGLGRGDLSRLFPPAPYLDSGSTGGSAGTSSSSLGSPSGGKDGGEKGGGETAASTAGFADWVDRIQYCPPPEKELIPQPN